MLVALTIQVWYGLGALGCIAGGAATTGIVLGQLRRGVIEELRESLRTAQVEIDINRSIVSRLDEAMKKIEGRCEHLETENKNLRTAVETGAALVPFMREEFAKFQDQVVARHKILAQALPEPVKTSLLDALR